MSLEADYLGAFEEHSPEEIRIALARGASATKPILGKTPVDFFIEGYLRSARFVPCLQVLLNAGASIEDPLLAAVLLDDDAALRKMISDSNTDLNRRFSIPCAFTSCDGVTALHICAEFNHVRAAKVLIEAGSDINAVANFDA